MILLIIWLITLDVCCPSSSVCQSLLFWLISSQCILLCPLPQQPFSTEFCCARPSTNANTGNSGHEGMEIMVLIWIKHFEHSLNIFKAFVWHDLKSPCRKKCIVFLFLKWRCFTVWDNVVRVWHKVDIFSLLTGRTKEHDLWHHWYWVPVWCGCAKTETSQWIRWHLVWFLTLWPICSRLLQVAFTEVRNSLHFELIN